ncbi:BA14K family protein [Cohaesibacter celericrescens]|uniref:Lectin-like protein BA14k n=1 Tax=Cohaesibacter celericrescens TaxID=2067669 RepID=A0A2N5XRY1_9HYPH|nr:BA14K family protein [Cohaesibacter celericrescens]PLW77207.1 hypothetical protein C0081_10695 [Cohaesibacter celericrescens]
MKIKHSFFTIALALGLSIGALPLSVPGTSLGISTVSEAQAHRIGRPHRHYRRPAIRHYRRPAPRRYYRPPPRRYCNVRACSAHYRSFRAYDCTFQPYNGPRRVCRR